MSPRPPRFAAKPPPLRAVACAILDLDLPEGHSLLAHAWTAEGLRGWMRVVYAEREYARLRAEGVDRGTARRVVGSQVGRCERTIARWTDGCLPASPDEEDAEPFRAAG